MATHSDFEHRRRERLRRERRRKKRIRAVLILIAFIALVILICIGISTCKKSNDTNVPASTDGQTITETPSPSGDAVIPTVAPATSLLSIPPASEENDLMQIIRDSGEEKYCYLTFDDGPTENITPQILDTLRRYNVKATFFQIGSLIKANPDMARRVYEEGHLIANHSDGHNYAKLYVSTDTFMNEINDCYEQIKEVTGEAEPFKLVRFPGGSFKSSADSYSPVKQECKRVMADYGFYQCDWNALNGDAEGKTKDADELLDYLISNLDGEENVVVLMHDAAAKQATADALASIIKYFMDEGYTFHRLDDIDYHASSSTSTVSSSSSSSYTDDEDADEDYDSDEDEDTESSSSSSSSSSTSSSKSTAAPTQRPASSSSSGSTGNGRAIIIQ